MPNSRRALPVCVHRTGRPAHGFPWGSPHRPFATGQTPLQGDSPGHRDTDSSGTVSKKGAVPLLHYRRKRHDDYEH